MIKVTAISFSVFPSSCPIVIPNQSARVFPLRYFVLFSLCCLQISDSLDVKYVKEQVTISKVYGKWSCK